LRILENRVLIRISGPKRDKVTGGWRKLYNEELHNLYTSQNIIRMIKARRMKWEGHVVCIRQMTNVYKILVQQPVWKRPLGRARHR
jgi:hypothetical protein